MTTYEKKEIITEEKIQHVNHDKDHHVGTTGYDQHNVGHVGTTDHHDVGKTGHVGTTEHVGTTGHHDVGKTGHVGTTEHVGTTGHHDVGKTGHVGTTEHVGTTGHHDVGKTGHVGTTEHVGTTGHHDVGKTGHVGTTEHVATTDHHHDVGKTGEHKIHKDKKSGDHVHKKKVKSDHVMNDTEVKPSKREKAKEKLHNLGEKVGLVKPETHTTTITEEYNSDGTKKIVKEERSHPEHVGFGKPETELIRTEEIVDVHGNRTILTKEGRENVGLLTQPESHKTKVKVEHGIDGRDKIVTERKDNPEHVGLFLPETAKIKTEEYVEKDGTRTIKTKEGTEHMGLATHPETHKTYAKVEGESDGSRKIDKEIRSNPEQIGIGKPKTDVVKTKEYVDPYGNKNVQVVEGQEHKGLGGTGTTTGYGNHDTNVGHHGTNAAGYHDTNVGTHDPGYKGTPVHGTGVGSGTGDSSYKHPA